MRDLTLVVMTAVIDNYFNCMIRQLVPFRSNDKIIMNYSHAIEASFNKVFFVFRKIID